MLPALGIIPFVCAGVAFATIGSSRAEGAEGDQAELAERCAIRLSIAIAGKSPDAALLRAPDPTKAVDKLVASPEFADRYARFINAEFNGAPSLTGADDPVYYLARHVITGNKPWSDLFTGPYALTVAGDGMDVSEDAEGLGYFRSSAWRKRYAGNESTGLMLVGAFRILSNTTGLDLIPTVGNPGDDRTVEGRKGANCKSCHYDAWYALDTYAQLLPKRKGEGDAMTFTDPTGGPQKVLGKTVANDKELVGALVDSDAWRFHQCRNVFKFLHGRPENQCEGVVFDKCVDALTNDKTIRAAVTAVATDPSFCK